MIKQRPSNYEYKANNHVKHEDVDDDGGTGGGKGKNYSAVQSSNRQQENEQQAFEDAEAQAYLEHLLNDGSKEGDSGAKIEMPSWYNEQLFKKGQMYFKKYRFVMKSGMLAGLVAVLSIPSILKVLICTGQSSTAKTAYRRYIRTNLHTSAWYTEPPDGKSLLMTSIRAVRRAHNRSSQSCKQQGAGMITQKDLALTQFGFIGFITLGAHRIELYDPEFLEATAHMWRVLGYLLGIKNEYNICGENWYQTRLRLDIVMRKVYAPALENTGADFERMTKALLDGLWLINTSLTFGSFLYMTKRLACVKGYEYYDFDFIDSSNVNNKHLQHRYYKDLGWLDRLIVFYALFIVTYLHKYRIVRWYLNFRAWLADQFMKYLPYLAIFKYGFKWAYVRIFTSDGNSIDFDTTVN